MASDWGCDEYAKARGIRVVCCVGCHEFQDASVAPWSRVVEFGGSEYRICCGVCMTIDALEADDDDA